MLFRLSSFSNPRLVSSSILVATEASSFRFCSSENNKDSKAPNIKIGGFAKDSNPAPITNKTRDTNPTRSAFAGGMNLTGRRTLGAKQQQQQEQQQQQQESSSSSTPSKGGIFNRISKPLSVRPVLKSQSATGAAGASSSSSSSSVTKGRGETGSSSATSRLRGGGGQAHDKQNSLMGNVSNLHRLKNPSRDQMKTLSLVNLANEGEDLQRFAAAQYQRHYARRHSISLHDDADPSKENKKFMGKLRHMPLNPQMQDPTKETMRARVPGKDPNAISHSTSRRKLSNLKFTDAQTDAIIDAYANKQWYGFIWRRMRFLNPDNIRRNKRFAIGGVWICLFVIIGISYYWYKVEMEIFMMMDPRDQRDFKKVLFGARIGETSPVAKAALEKVDPLSILPPRERAHIVVEAFREAGFVDKDWELEARKRKSLFQEFDYEHVAYWFIMYFGRWCIGGGFLWTGIEEEQLRKEEEIEKDLNIAATLGDRAALDSAGGGNINSPNIKLN